ncbi:PE-PGRS family domain protein [Mycobacterium ulcerans str. Harvey]|uniref:PE-PGRS family domain protein n=1 Tax=Mycobacterium ulcerans str. Harvey TaxID=1299332 RepID=A0ABN0R0E5_MYCUL|nr:PE-PGRS family domain protein [Mycobacterium ulcerans str. Harvey]
MATAEAVATARMPAWPGRGRKRRSDRQRRNGRAGLRGGDGGTGGLGAGCGPSRAAGTGTPLPANEILMRVDQYGNPVVTISVGGAPASP